VPQIYLTAGLTGAVAGLGLRRWLGRWSWVLAMAGPAFVWIASAATGFTKGRASGTVQELRDGLVSALRPGESWERTCGGKKRCSAPLPCLCTDSSPPLRVRGGWEAGAIAARTCTAFAWVTATRVVSGGRGWRLRSPG